MSQETVLAHLNRVIAIIETADEMSEWRGLYEALVAARDEANRLVDRTITSYIEVRTTACHAGSDGDCNWSECPQKTDYQSHCPLTGVPVKPWSPAAVTSEGK